MKTLEHEVILHDQDCPMCRIYTGAFVSTKMIEGRVPYSEGIKQYAVDRDRARHEIALVNTRTGAVTYGLDSLIKILGNNFPFIKSLLNIRPFRWFMNLVYHFISYNRKVIAPGRLYANACIPDFHMGYRITYLLFTWLVCSLILAQFAGKLSGFIDSGSYYREFMICGGQILFQAVFASLWHRDRWMEYLGNMMTVSLIGSLLILPFIWIQLPPMWNIAVFLTVVGLMLAEHIRRLRLLEMTGLLTFTWVMYRLLILNFIL